MKFPAYNAPVRTARQRVRYELGTIALLLVCIAAALLLRGRSGSDDAKASFIQVPALTEPLWGELFEWKPGQYVRVEYGSDTSTALDTDGFTDPSTKNAADLVKWAEMAWEHRWGYVWGTFGFVLTEDLLSDRLAMYGDDVGDYMDIIRSQWMGHRVADCMGLIKGYGWYDPDAHEIRYGYGDMVDLGTDGMYQTATVKGEIASLPEKPGVLLYAPGHIGVYIGNGFAIEAMSHAAGVVKTKVASRPWIAWLECPYIHYD